MSEHVAAADLIGEVPKNATEIIRVQRTEYNGVDLIDVRVWTSTVDPADAKPTKKGLTLRPETWRALLKVIEPQLGIEN